LLAIDADEPLAGVEPNEPEDEDAAFDDEDAGLEDEDADGLDPRPLGVTAGKAEKGSDS
jgi:hypothetical protein